MTPHQAENLRILIRYMESLTNVSHLNMRYVEYPHSAAYVGPQGKLIDLPKDKCGTPACAWGHVKLIPELKCQLQRLGDHLPDDGPVLLFGMSNDMPRKHETDWSRLFGSVLGGDSAYDNSDPTPKEWAVAARKYLASQGYTMEPPIDQKFQEFKEKLECLTSCITTTEPA